MNLCSDGHDEVCYESRKCPVCKMKDQIKGLKADMDTLEDRIKDLKENSND